MTIWKPIPTTDEPSTELRDWRVVSVTSENETTIHFIGYCYEGRVSSAIQTYDKKIHTGISASGRQYKLLGKTGYSSDAEYVFGRWISRFPPDAQVVDISKDY